MVGKTEVKYIFLQLLNELVRMDTSKFKFLSRLQNYSLNSTKFTRSKYIFVVQANAIQISLLIYIYMYVDRP